MFYFSQEKYQIQRNVVTEQEVSDFMVMEHL